MTAVGSAHEHSTDVERGEALPPAVGTGGPGPRLQEGEALGRDARVHVREHAAGGDGSHGEDGLHVVILDAVKVADLLRCDWMDRSLGEPYETCQSDAEVELRFTCGETAAFCTPHAENMLANVGHGEWVYCDVHEDHMKLEGWGRL